MCKLIYKFVQTIDARHNQVKVTPSVKSPKLIVKYEICNNF